MKNRLDHSEVETLLADFGQQHVVEAARRADNPDDVLAALARPELADVLKAVRTAVEGGASAVVARRDLEPPPVVRCPELAPDDPHHAEAFERGVAALRAGQVALLTVAGGMGTRLGWSGPKGTFPIGPVTNRSLFALYGETIAALSRRYEVALPWVIMTSPLNDEATRAHFAAHEFFGLQPDQVHFATQGVFAAFDLRGRIVLGDDGRPVCLPDGHGGVYAALRRTGLLEHFERSGVEVFFYFQVDNPLCRIADPYFLGRHLLEGAEMSTKVVEKREPDERVGLVVRTGAALRIVEYSELPAELAARRDPSGRLLLRAANTAIHAIDRALVDRVARGDIRLPVHLARKPVPVGAARHIDGYKPELFVFDAMPYARGALAYEVIRDLEFAPVKSAQGSDTPGRARELLSALYRRMAVEAGLGEALPAQCEAIEISPLDALDAAELRRAGPGALKWR